MNPFKQPPEKLQILPILTETWSVWKSNLKTIVVLLLILYLPFYILLSIAAEMVTQNESLLTVFGLSAQFIGSVLLIITTAIIGGMTAQTRSNKPFHLKQLSLQALRKIGFLIVPAFVPIVILIAEQLLATDTELINQITQLVNQLSIVLVFLIMWFVMISAFYLFSLMTSYKDPIAAFTNAVAQMRSQFVLATMYMIVLFFSYSIIAMVLTLVVPLSLAAVSLIIVPIQIAREIVGSLFIVLLAVIFFRIEEVSTDGASSNKPSSKQSAQKAPKTKE